MSKGEHQISALVKKFWSIILGKGRKPKVVADKKAKYDNIDKGALAIIGMSMVDYIIPCVGC